MSMQGLKAQVRLERWQIPGHIYGRIRREAREKVN